jgi:hypothetical protein
MDEVTRYERLRPLGRNPHTDMAGGMAGRRFEPHFIAEFVIGLDSIQKAGGQHWVHAITHVIAELLLFPVPRPVIVFAAGNQVPCVFKRRLPFAVHKQRVPTDMVDVQVSTQDVIETARQKSCRFQITEERAAKHIRPLILSRFVVAEARIDDDAAAWSFDYECMN